MIIAQWLKSCGLDQKTALKLIADVLKIGSVDQTAYYFTHQDNRLSEHQVKTLDEYTARIIHGEPIQYVLGHARFGDLDLKVDSRVLIPRPETEELVELVIQRLSSSLCYSLLATRYQLSLADVGTGSGAIALSLAKWCTDNQLSAQIIATDISKPALDVAKNNYTLIKSHHTLPPISFRHGYLLQGVDEKLDVIVANLPYVPTHKMRSLPKNVRDFEPRLALDGGAEGLDLITDLINDARRVLKPNGLIFLELWDQHAKADFDLFADQYHIEIKPDGFGSLRFAILTSVS